MKNNFLEKLDYDEKTIKKPNVPEELGFEEHKKEVKSIVENSIKTITYISFVITIGLSLITTVVIGIKAESWKDKWSIILLVFAIIFSITCSFWFIMWKIHKYYFKNSLENNKYKKEYYEILWKEKLKELKATIENENLDQER